MNTDTYDNNGNTLVGRLSLSSTSPDNYDFENRLVTEQPAAQTTIDILYDGDGNRVSKTVTTATNTTTTCFVVDDLNPSGYAQVLEELSILDPPSSTIAVTAVYTYGHTLISQTLYPSTLNSQPSTSFYGYDGHNNVRYLTDLNGNVTDTYDYDAFGNLTGASGDTANCICSPANNSISTWDCIIFAPATITRTPDGSGTWILMKATIPIRRVCTNTTTAKTIRSMITTQVGMILTTAQCSL